MVARNSNFAHTLTLITMTKIDIVLVSMPFAPFWSCNAGIGVLTGAAKNAGLSVKATYPCIRFGQTIGAGLYNIISENYLARQTLLGDWLFSSLMQEPDHESFKQYEQHYHQEILKAQQASLLDASSIPYSHIHALQDACAALLADETRRIAALTPRIVGCSSTFIQHGASLALLKNIKAVNPKIITMIGGANCEADMGYETALQFPWVDFVFSGEADHLFPSLCRRILSNEHPVRLSELPYGVYTYEKAQAQKLSPYSSQEFEVAIVHEMDTVSMPDYDEYVEEREQSGLSGGDFLACAVESARGCQKGERALCNFCGLNGARVCYRNKSPETFLAELGALHKKYGSNVFLLTDNIVSNKAFSEWLQKAAERQTWTFFLETRSTLTEEQVKLLSTAQVFEIQPGIESLNDHLLQLMNKGNSALLNIAFMKYAREQAVKIAWNMLYHIPGETDADYWDLADLIPLLHHLSPPNQAGPISFCKFSRYYTAPEYSGLKLMPLPAYAHVYSGLSPEALQRIAYHFINAAPDGKEGLPLSDAKQLMLQRVNEWQSLYNFPLGTEKRIMEKSIPILVMRELNGLIKIRDSRGCAVSSLFVLDEVESAIYKYARHPVTLETIRTSMSQDDALRSSMNKVEESLQSLIENKLLLNIGDKYLSLAVFPSQPISGARKQGLKYLRKQSQLLASMPCSGDCV